MFFGIGVCDISTCDFFVTELKEDNNFSKLLDEISRYQPSEIIINKMMSESEEEMKTAKRDPKRTSRSGKFKKRTNRTTRKNCRIFKTTSKRTSTKKS